MNWAELDFQYSPQEFILCATDSGGLVARMLLTVELPKLPPATLTYTCAYKKQCLLIHKEEREDWSVFLLNSLTI